MKRLFAVAVVAVILGVTSQALAWRAVTKSKGSYAACVYLADLKQALKYAALKKYKALEKMFADGRCMWLKGGVEVEVFEKAGSAWTGMYYRIHKVGNMYAFWVIQEAVVAK
ncbi:hypothetical protein ES705_15845 [subsurface metagenome]